MEKQFVVLGLGIFGSTLVKTLSQYGREVITKSGRFCDKSSYW